MTQSAQVGASGARAGAGRPSLARSLPALAVALAAAAAVAGCGGSSRKPVTARADTPAATGPSATAATTTAAGATRTTPKRASTGHAPTPAHPPHPSAHGHGHQVKPPSLGPALAASSLSQRANAACATADAKISAIARPGDFATNRSAAATYLRRLISVRSAEISALHLNPPVSLRGTYIRFFGNMLREELFLVLASNQAMTGQNGYVTQYESAVRFRQSQVAPLARQLHLPSCA